jgi:hypothetical protein
LKKVKELWRRGEELVNEEGCRKERWWFMKKKKKKVICKEGYSIRTTKEFAKKVVREEGYLRRWLWRKKVVYEEERFVKEEGCSTRTTNELAEEGG